MVVERKVNLVEILPLLAVCHSRAARHGIHTILGVKDSKFAESIRGAMLADPERAMEAVRVLIHRGLSSNFLSLLGSWNCANILDQPILELLHSVERLYVSLQKQQMEFANQFCELLSAKEIVAVSLKSFDVLERFNDSNVIEPRYDIDFLIRWDDYEIVNDVCTQDLDAFQGEFRNGRVAKHKDPRDLDTSKRHYEWWPFLRPGPELSVDSAVQPLVEVSWPFAPGELNAAHIKTFLSLDLHYGCLLYTSPSPRD